MASTEDEKGFSRIANANNHLAASVFKCLSGDNNAFISPFSLSTAFTMLYCGARGEAATEIDKILGHEFTDLEEQNIPNVFSQFLAMLEVNQDSYVLSGANAMMTQQKFKVKERYKTLLKEVFSADMFEVDFASNTEAALDHINSWVSEKTNEMVPKLLDSLDPQTVVVLLNAMYFKGKWVHPFEKLSTHQRSFYNYGMKEGAKKVDMMYMEERFNFVEKDAFQVIELPYIGNKTSMFVLLPKNIDGIEEIVSGFAKNQIKELRSEMKNRKVEVYLPKFKIEYKKSLKNTFQSLGVSKLFEQGANLSGMSDCKDLCVTDVVHKAVIEVNEEGSEAAAATAMRVAYLCAINNPLFIADHPFLFAIYDTKYDATLFIGKVDEL